MTSCKMSYLNDADFTSSTSPSPSSISPHDNPELNPDFNYLLKGEPNMSLSPIISQEAALVRPDRQNFESNVRPTVKSELVPRVSLTVVHFTTRYLSQLNHLHSLVCTVVPLSELSTSHLHSLVCTVVPLSELSTNHLQLC